MGLMSPAALAQCQAAHSTEGDLALFSLMRSQGLPSRKHAIICWMAILPPLLSVAFAAGDQHPAFSPSYADSPCLASQIGPHKRAGHP